MKAQGNTGIALLFLKPWR